MLCRLLLFVRAALVLIAFALLACGSGGGSSGDGDGEGGDAGFEIGGTISGLSGSVRLQNNGGDTLRRSRNGDFVFDGRLDDGEPYFVTVFEQPVDQVCAVSNGAGLVDDDDVDDIEVECADVAGAWGTATRIENLDVSHADEIQVDIDNLGNAVAVWLQDDGTTENVVANRYVAGGSWGTPLVISDDDIADDAEAPQVAMDDAGNAIAVWRQRSNGQYSLFSNRYQFGVGWGDPELLETVDDRGVSDPQVAFHRATGEAIAIWRQGQSLVSGTFVWVSHFSPLSDWSDPVRIESLTAEDADNPRVAVNDAGDAVAVWENIDGEIRANAYTSIGGWGTAGLVDALSTVNGSNPQVAIDSDGNAVAVWEDAEGAGRVSVRSSRLAAGGAWAASEPIDSALDSLAYGPQVAIDASGDAIAVWHESVGTGFYRVYANRLPAGGTWGAAQIVSDDTVDDDVHPPRLAIDDAGNATVVYGQTYTLDDAIMAVRYEAGIGWSTPEAIDDDEGQIRFEPAVAMNAGGDTVGVWVQRPVTVSRFDAWANFYQPDP